MINYIIPVEKIKRAQIRFLDEEGVEIPEIKAYTIFIKKECSYINLFNLLEDCNVYERLPYSNVTPSGEAYGTKIRLVHGNKNLGKCYVLDFKKMDELEGLEEISLMDLYMIVLKSNDFYPDRKEIIRDHQHIVGYREKRRILEKDSIMIDKFYDYLEEKQEELENKKVYKK